MPFKASFLHVTGESHAFFLLFICRFVDFDTSVIFPMSFRYSLFWLSSIAGFV